MTDEREEIARIIDHEGFWKRLDRCNHALANAAMTDDQRRNLIAVRDDELRGTAESLAKADAILARDEGRRGVVGGDWVLVPREITRPMRFAAWKADYLDAGASDAEASVRAAMREADPEEVEGANLAWSAMIAAAPSPPVADKVGEQDKGSSQGSGQRGCGSRDEPAVGATAALAKEPDGEATEGDYWRDRRERMESGETPYNSDYVDEFPPFGRF